MTINRLRKLKEGRAMYPNGASLDLSLRNDKALRAEIEFLAFALLDRKVQGCLNCYTDAYFELINFDEKMAMEKTTCIFHLKHGVLLKDINGDKAKMMSNHNISNELALYHLQTNPNCKRFFDRPSNIDAVIEEMTAPKVEVTERVPKRAKARLSDEG